jgi:hypothetical protein
MNFDFVASNRNLNMGSYRIWVHDLSQTLKELGHSVTINEDFKNKADVIICSKGDYGRVDKLKEKYPKAKIGVINPSASKKTNADFIIVGSVEEMCSFSWHDNVFLYPLIERMYQKSDLKVHSEKERLVLGYHGHEQHLTKFSPCLKAALEKFQKECDFKLLVVTSSTDPVWNVGKPNIKEVEYVKWDIKSAKKNIQKIDIGLVPNITDIKPKDKIKTSSELGLYDSDYMVRFKNKSNAGRAFVFVQLGVPVVVDLTPSNLHLFGNTDAGYVAMNSKSWLKALRKLKDHSHRDFVSKEAIKEFKVQYNPHTWAGKLTTNIERIR